ncbi:MAG: Flp family type IVb pilin, partial [Candidatus Hinthialibacter sp.]
TNALEEKIMSKAIQAVKQFLVAEDGPTAVEYAVLLGLIIVATIGLVMTLGGSVKSIFQTASDEVGTAATTAAAGGSAS